MESAEFRTGSLNFCACDLKATGSFELEAVRIALSFALPTRGGMLAGLSKRRFNSQIDALRHFAGQWS
jgi:hypothetical protein